MLWCTTNRVLQLTTLRYIPSWSNLLLIFSRLDEDEFVACEQWASLFWLEILLPWLAVMGVALLILKKNGSDMLREIWLPMIQWNSRTTPPKSNRNKPILVDPESQQIPKNQEPEPPLNHDVIPGNPTLNIRKYIFLS